MQRALTDIVHRLKLFVERSEKVTDTGREYDEEELKRLKGELAKLSKKVEEKLAIEAKAKAGFSDICYTKAVRRSGVKIKEAGQGSGAITGSIKTCTCDVLIKTL